MAVDTSVIGKPTMACKVTVDRSMVSNFAAGVTDSNPIFADQRAADAAGFDDVAAPPTFSFALSYWGAYQAEQQPPDPTGGDNPMFKVMGQLFAKGGLVLHGEQEFEYHRAIEVGDTLVGSGKITDVYEKDTDKALMTFIVMETQWTDDATGDPVVTERFNLIHRLTK
ncbi:MAG TPA: MaoC family dehydratase N-terminal domain-containing protein [Acidimicrobiia bacterium]|jgi:acyl dehydratase|nr:MaoC family dehydratase N-terminal domain-containing protein [Acidimicrobiia bacterium]